MNNKKESILITGATGFLGRSLVKEFLLEGREVVCLIRPSSPHYESFKNDFPEAKIIKINLEDIKLLPSMIKHVGVFIHLAWEGTDSNSRFNRTIQEKNLIFSQNALIAASKVGARMFIFSGSQAEYGKYPFGTQERESDETKPESEYGKFKKSFGEWGSSFCYKNNMDFIHLRIFSVFGTGDKKDGLINSLISASKTDSSIRLGPCTQMWNYLYIDDFARIISRLIQINNINCILNIASNISQPLNEYVNDFCSSICFHKYHFSTNNPNQEGLVNLFPDISLLTRTIGQFPFTSFVDGVAKMVI
jgi:nucleoside-diphosphate-sugar epimerase